MTRRGASGTEPELRIFAATPLYIQGPGAIARVGKIAADIGETPGVIIDTRVRTLVGDTVMGGFATPPRLAPFAGEVTDTNIGALAAALQGCDVIIGVGGGKTLDVGKGVALRLRAAFISVPTIASTDGPASRGVAIYDDTHRLVRVDQLPANPAAVIVDSAVIAMAPARFLRAGIGDAIAKKFEAEACRRGGGLNKHGTTATHSALAIADAAYRLLRTHAVDALAAAEQGLMTESLEATIEACVLLSALGFENGRLSIAHSVTRGLMVLPAARERLHGEHVAYGVLVQLAVERQSDAALDDLASFLRSVGLPTSLAGLGVDHIAEAGIAEMAAAIMTSPHIRAIDRDLTDADIAAAIHRVERLA